MEVCCLFCVVMVIFFLIGLIGLICEFFGGDGWNVGFCMENFIIFCFDLEFGVFVV